MPSSQSIRPCWSASSTWSLGAAMSGLVPHSRTTGLADSSEPTGQASWVRFGMLRSSSVWRAEAASAAASRAAICSLMARTSASMAEVSSPLALSMPICLEMVLRELCSCCLSVSALRRASSQASTSSTSFQWSPPRVLRRSWTAAGFSRMTRISSMARRLSRPMAPGNQREFSAACQNDRQEVRIFTAKQP